MHCRRIVSKCLLRKPFGRSRSLGSLRPGITVAVQGDALNSKTFASPGHPIGNRGDDHSQCADRFSPILPSRPLPSDSIGGNAVGECVFLVASTRLRPSHGGSPAANSGIAVQTFFRSEIWAAFPNSWCRVWALQTKFFCDTQELLFKSSVLLLQRFVRGTSCQFLKLLKRQFRHPQMLSVWSIQAKWPGFERCRSFQLLFLTKYAHLK